MKSLVFILLSVMLTGCAHQQFVTDARNPEIAVDERGVVTYRGDVIDPDDLPDALKDSGLSSRDTIHIRIPSNTKDYRMPYYVMGVLVKNGFTRPVFVESRRAFSEVHKVEKTATAAPARRTIRYK